MSIERRTETKLTPQKLFDEVLYSRLHWPGKTVRLERSSLDEYCQRAASASISIAELYHENSKLYRQMLPEITAMRLNPSEIRSEFLHRRSAASNAAHASTLHLLQCWLELLSLIATHTDPELFYAVELRIVAGDRLAVHEPLSNTLQLIKQLSVNDLQALQDAVRLMPAPEDALHNGPLLFLLGNFARNDLLFGPRGYRRTLLEAGRISEAVISHAMQLGLKIKPRHEFTDRDLDNILEADGIEEGVLIVFELNETSNVP